MRLRSSRERAITHEKIEKRDSHALEPQLITEPTAKAEAEARNVLRQYDAGLAVVQNALEHGSFKLRPSLILALHREALSGISIFAGNYPFSMTKGGYVIVKKDGKVTQEFGSKAKEKRFATEDRRGHRSEYRKPNGLRF